MKAFHCCDVGAFVGIGAQVEHLGHPQRSEWVRPDHQGAGAALLHEHEFPVLGSDCQHVTVVGGVDHAPAWAFVFLPCEVGQQVVAVDVDFVGLVADGVAGFERVDDVGFAGGGQERFSASRGAG